MYDKVERIGSYHFHMGVEEIVIKTKPKDLLEFDVLLLLGTIIFRMDILSGHQPYSKVH